MLFEQSFAKCENDKKNYSEILQNIVASCSLPSELQTKVKISFIIIITSLSSISVSQFTIEY